MAEKQLALLIDTDRCIGCHACTIACEEEHRDPSEVRRLRVATVGSGHHDIPGGTYPNVWMYFQPRMCQHCENPPCITSCPYDAIEKRDDGIVVILSEDCTGCELCLPACPYDVMVMNLEARVVAICDLCTRRTDVGLAPFCIECCPADALFFGDVNSRDSDINMHKLAIPKTTYLLSGGGEEQDRPAVQYVSRRPKKPEDGTILAAD